MLPASFVELCETKIQSAMPVQNGNILIVDDNESILSTLKILLTPQFQNVVAISDPGRLLTELGKKEFNIVILDMNFRAGVNSGNEGIYWLSRIKEAYPEMSVIMMTAYGDVEIAVKALKAGAADFVMKPWDNEKLVATIKMAVQLNLSKKEVIHLKERETGLKNELNREQKYIIGSSPAILGVLNLARKVAKTDANILITGENGQERIFLPRRSTGSPQGHLKCLSVSMSAR
jgi:DNA-binding NtrC family response regulator